MKTRQSASKSLCQMTTEEDPPISNPLELLKRWLSYVNIDEAFYDQVSDPYRYRNLKLAMSLDMEEREYVHKVATQKGSEDPGLVADSLRFMKLHKAVNYYKKINKFKSVNWYFFDEKGVDELIKLM